MTRSKFQPGDLAMCIRTLIIPVIRPGEIHTVVAVLHPGLLFSDVTVPPGYDAFDPVNFIRIDPENLLTVHTEKETVPC